MFASLYFIRHDALRYLDYGTEAYRHHWDLRSYVLICAFVVIRLTDFVPLPLPVEDEEARRSVFEWLCWVVPLLTTEIWLSWRPAVRVALGAPSNDRLRLTRAAPALRPPA